MARTNNTGLLPNYLKDSVYDHIHKICSDKTLSLEMEQRQTLFSNVKNFEDFYLNPSAYSGSPFYPGIELTLIHQKHINSLPNNREELTKEEKIKIDRDFYLDKLQSLSEGLYSNLQQDNLNTNSNDFRPYIRPIINLDSNIQKNLDPSWNEFRGLSPIKNQTTIVINLDFSVEAIIEETRKHIKFLKKDKIEENQKYKKPKNTIHKLRQQKILQVIDIYLWMLLNKTEFTYDSLAILLYPNGQYSEKQFKETVMRNMRKILVSKEPDSEFIFYTADIQMMKTNA